MTTTPKKQKQTTPLESKFKTLSPETITQLKKQTLPPDTPIQTINVPIIKEWAFVMMRGRDFEDKNKLPYIAYSVRGKVYGSEHFANSQAIITSEITHLSKPYLDTECNVVCYVIETLNSAYVIFEDDVHPEYKRVYRNIQQTLEELREYIEQTHIN